MSKNEKNINEIEYTYSSPDSFGGRRLDKPTFMDYFRISQSHVLTHLFLNLEINQKRKFWKTMLIVHDSI